MTHHTDIYSAGMVLFECFAPHTKLRMNDLAHQVEDPRVVEIITRACETEVSDRYQDASHFSIALEGLTKLDTSENGIAICPKPGCASGVFSTNGYFRGPQIIESTDRHCKSCGELLLRNCPGCYRPIPENIGQFTITTSKGEQDQRTAHCGSCGRKLYETPVYPRCSSLIKATDFGRDLSKTGCTKCQYTMGYGSHRKAPPPIDDSDLPF